MSYRRIVKPLTDRLFAALGLVALSPVICAVATVVRWRMGGQAVFRQIRVGLNDVPFEFLKFRTMTQECDANGALQPDERRMTPLGTFLRSSSLDELPQLWNVLRGDMSLIGPRPLLPEYLPRYTRLQRRRHEVKPGITGWAQVKGRNDLAWERKFELDVWYVERCCLKIDLIILWMTLSTVLRKKGISQRGYATAPVFLGTEDSTRRSSEQSVNS